MTRTEREGLPNGKPFPIRVFTPGLNLSLTKASDLVRCRSFRV